MQTPSSASRVPALLLFGLLLLGVMVRLPGLADDPPAFHMMRQLHSATIAKAMHLDLTRPADDEERVRAVRPSSIEPPVNETIVSRVYLVTGGERLWVARAMSIAYWTVGAAALWTILRRFTNLTGQVVGVAFYQLAPIGIEGGRSFQPDALMIGLALVGMLLQVRLVERPSIRRAAPALAVTAAALIIKPVAAPIVLGFWAGLVLWRYDWPKLLSPRVIGATAVMVAPAVAVYAWLLRTKEGARVHSDRSFFPDLFGQWSYYESTWTMITGSVTVVGILLAIVATCFADARPRRILLVLWLGYVAYNIPSNYRTATHDYYHLPIVFIVAMALGMATEPAQRFLETQTRPLVHRSFAAAALAVLAVATLSAATTRHEAPGGSSAVARYRDVGELLGPGTQVLAVTPDYASGLQYYGGLNTRSYPTPADENVLRLAGERVPSAAELLVETHADFLVVTDHRMLTYFEDLVHEIGELEPYHRDDPLVVWDLRD